MVLRKVTTGIGCICMATCMHGVRSHAPLRPAVVRGAWPLAERSAPRPACHCHACIPGPSPSAVAVRRRQLAVAPARQLFSSPGWIPAADTRAPQQRTQLARARGRLIVQHRTLAARTNSSSRALVVCSCARACVRVRIHLEITAARRRN